MYVNHFPAGQRPLAAPDAHSKAQAGAAEASDTNANVQFIVEARGCEVFQYRFDGEKIATVAAEILRIANAQRAEVLGDGDISVGQVVAVEYDTLRVDLSPAHPQRVEKTKGFTERCGWHAVHLRRQCLFAELGRCSSLLQGLQRGAEAIPLLEKGIKQFPDDKRLRLTYARELFEASTIGALAGHYVAMLQALADDPARKVGEVALLGAAELHERPEEATPTAEIAFSVERQLQHRGIGALLFERLIAQARGLGYTRLRVEAGHDWDALVEYATGEGLSGIVAMSGIPGTVGAAPVQNIGAYGQEIVETLVEVELIDEATGEVSTVSAADLALGFRTSVLKNHYGSVAPRPAVVLSVTLELREVGDGPFALSGAQLRQALGVAEDEQVTLRWVRETVLATRARKGMVLDPADPDTRSAGSFFQNAIVSASFARTLPAECPRWPVSTTAAPLDAPDRVIPLAVYEGIAPAPEPVQPDVKVSAAWLIEHAGLRKGFRLPRSRAGLSTKHALAVTNRGDATAGEIAELARYIQSRVQSEFGLILQPEPVLVGVEL